MSKFKEAREREATGDYRAAGALFAKYAFDQLVECNFDPEIEMRVALSHLLRAISCDVRAHNDSRAQHLFDIARPLFQKIGEDADSRVLEGLTKEWTGDGLLMLGSSEAIDLYREANEYYDDLEWGERSWGHEQEFHYASIALEAFLKEYGYEFPDEPHMPLHFNERIEFKINVAEEILNN